MPKTTIEWTEHTWKIVQGCLKGCPWCYVKRFDKQWNAPRFNEKVINEPCNRKEPTMYFVANTGDAFGDWVPASWIDAMMKVMENCPQHIFQLLTKNPKRYKEFEHRFTRNIWVGASVTCNEQIPFIDEVRYVKNAGVHFISFEPLMEALDLTKVDLTGIDWCIVGAESIGSADNPKNLKLSQQYASPLIAGILEAKICLFTKPNLQWNPAYKEMPISIGRSCP